MKKTVLTSFTILCLPSTLFLIGLALNIGTVEGSGTVYIRPDGSIDPPSAPIQRVGNVYTLKWNVYDYIVVERSNITVDGDGYRLQGTGFGIGLDLTGTTNVTIKNMEIRGFRFGIWLYYPFQSSNNRIIGNTVENNTYGIWVFASNNTLSRNIIENSSDTGVVIDLGSSNNTIIGNRIMNNTRGVWIIMASDNKFYHNNFINNTQQVHIPVSGHTNSWDNAYPSGGNYWSDHTCTGNPSNGSHPYVIDSDNTDYYPFQDPDGWLKVHNVDTGLDYTTIQEAIDASETLNGHTILVDSGTYYENLVVKKSVSLIGESKDTTIIDGGEWDGVVILEANEIVLRNFTIKGAAPLYPIPAIVMGGTGINITDNIIVGNPVGLSMDSSSGNAILRNTFQNNYDGLYLKHSVNNQIVSNTFFDNYRGIYLELSWNNVLRNNVLFNNTHNLVVEAYEDLNPYINDVDHSNTVNGKPIYYWVNQANKRISTDAGQVVLVNSTNIIVEDLTLTNNGAGVLFAYTTDSIVQNITTANNSYGIVLKANSKRNIIVDNTISNNSVGIGLLWGSTDNLIYHNMFERNILAQATGEVSANHWDNAYPSGGNYWSDYTDVDLYSGLNQDETGSDGIGDTPYNQDNYPLMGVFSDFNATSEHHIRTICNSTITDFTFNGTAIFFNVTGEDGTVGFCRICIPTALLNDTYRVFLNDTEVPHTLLPCSNSTHNYLYFTYPHSTQEIVIIPEFPFALILPLLMIFTLIVVMLSKKKNTT